jgi:acetyltransferase-like isoleucine patch superfamily enzyme
MIIRVVFLDPHERCGPTGAASFGLDVTIEDQVWIGGGVTVLGGVTIGKGSAIGAASLVTKVSCSALLSSRIPFSSTSAYLVPVV